MKAITEFVTRITSDGSFIKVVLNYNHNIYKYHHKDIDFFIHRDHWSGLWNAIELQSGSSIVTDYHTKKECLKYALLRIDNIIDIDTILLYQIGLTRSARIMNMNEYIALEG